MSQAPNSPQHQQIETLLTSSLPNRTLIIQVPMENTLETNAHLIKFLQEKDYHGVYVTLVKNYSVVAKKFLDHAINPEKITFIDGVSKLYCFSEVRAKNVVYITGPLALLELIDQIKAAISRIKTKKIYVMIDSLTILMLYNSIEQLVGFVQALNKIIGEKKIIAFALFLSDKNIKASLENSLEKEVIILNPGDLSS